MSSSFLIGLSSDKYPYLVGFQISALYKIKKRCQKLLYFTDDEKTKKALLECINACEIAEEYKKFLSELDDHLVDGPQDKLFEDWLINHGKKQTV